MQEDCLSSHLTVEEAMHQAAKLKLSKHISSEEIKEKIASLVENLGWKQEHQSWVVVKWKDWPLDLKCWTIHQLWYLMNLPLAWMLSMPCICSSYWKSWLKKGEPILDHWKSGNNQSAYSEPVPRQISEETKVPKFNRSLLEPTKPSFRRLYR